MMSFEELCAQPNAVVIQPGEQFQFTNTGSKSDLIYEEGCDEPVNLYYESGTFMAAKLSVRVDAPWYPRMSQVAPNEDFLRQKNGRP